MPINGQAIKQDFVILSKSVTQDTVLSEAVQVGCCFELPALAELTETSELKNDQHSVIWFFSQLFTDAQLTLEKYNGTEFEEVDVLDDNTYGKFHEFGFFVNKFGESAIGYQLLWRNVLVAWGEGDYRIKVFASPELGGDFEDYSFTFCLKKYLEHRADHTVRINWNRNGQFGDQFDDTKLNDYGILDWFNQIRLPEAFFGFTTQEQEKQFTKYGSGAEVWTIDNRLEKYLLTLKLYPAYLHRYLMRNITVGDVLTITDYNIKNPNKFVNRRVVYESSHTPDPIGGIDFDKMNVELIFKQEFQNLVRKRD
jgi:hypothetical protein